MLDARLLHKFYYGASWVFVKFFFIYHCI